jgi:hypothetical protein
MEVGEATFTPVATVSDWPLSLIRTPAPGWKPVPVSEVMVTGHPRLAVVGARPDRVGAAPVTVNPFASVPVSEYGSVTVTLYFAAVAPFRSKVQVICEAETTFKLVAVISGPAEAFTSFTVAPVRKFVPARLVILTVQPRTCVAGAIDVTVGVGVLTVNAFDNIPLLPSGLVTTTFHNPAVALAGMVNVHMIRFEDPALTLVALMFELPLFVRLIVAPMTNPLPPIETEFTVVPLRPDAGDIPVTVTSVDPMVNPLASIPLLPSALDTDTFHRPLAVPVGMERSQVIRVGELTTTLVAVIPVILVLFSLTVAPLVNPVPAILTL